MLYFPARCIVMSMNWALYINLLSGAKRLYHRMTTRKGSFHRTDTPVQTFVTSSALRTAECFGTLKRSSEFQTFMSSCVSFLTVDRIRSSLSEGVFSNCWSSELTVFPAVSTFQAQMFVLNNWILATYHVQMCLFVTCLCCVLNFFFYCWFLWL